MSTRLLPQSLRNALTGVVLAVSLLMFVGSSATTVQAARQQVTAGNTHVVNSAADTPGADVANPACADDN